MNALRPAITPGAKRTLAVLTMVAATCGCLPETNGPRDAGRSVVSPQPTDGRVVHDVPDEIWPEDNYLFYLHGQIIEDRGVRPVHPDFGVYEYEAVLASLAQAGFVVISEAREPRTDGEEYARKVAAQVETLLTAEVPPERISIVGFSKGGGIAVRVSALLHNESVNFTFLGTCPQRVPNPPALDLRGRILSIYEASDPLAGACSEFLSVSVVEPEFEELRLEVGGGHGAFYRPIRDWLDPVVAWSRGRNVRVTDER
jgi:hypothetical protein